MEFDGFRLFPREGRMVAAEEQRLVGMILSHAKVVERLPHGREVLVEVGRRINSGQKLAAAHNEWREEQFPNIETPCNLPRQPVDATTPPGLVHVTVAVIDKRTQGMGSHFGYVGYFLSLLVSLRDNTIWDARGERAI